MFFASTAHMLPKPAKPSKTLSVDEIRDAISNFEDRGEIEKIFSLRRSKTPLEAARVYDEYTKFLTMKVAFKAFNAGTFSPNAEIDEMWHGHVAWTESYARLNAIWGKENTVHHDPRLAFDATKQREKRRGASIYTYELLFDEKCAWFVDKQEEQKESQCIMAEAVQACCGLDSRKTSPNSFHVFVTTQTGERFSVDLTPGQTVFSFKKKVEEAHGILNRSKWLSDHIPSTLHPRIQ